MAVTRIRAFDALEVTSSAGGDTEVPPEDVGLARADVDAIWAAVVKAYRTRLYPAIGFAVRRCGQVLIDRAIGHASGNSPTDGPDARLVPATPRTLHNLFSASKMVTAMLIHLLDQRRQIHLDDRVCEYIPEFGRHGKDNITIRHVLVHRAGIPRVPARHVTPDVIADPERILDLLCDQKPLYWAGRRLAYHALTGGYILAEIIRRVTGKPVQRFLADEIATPLGFDHFRFGVAAEDLPRVAVNAFTGPRVVPPASTLLRRSLGFDFMDGVRWSNDPRFLTGVVPAGNLIATASETTRFMQLLLAGGELDGVRVFDPRTITRAIAEQSYLELDLTLAAPVRYGMGFMLGGNYGTIFGLKTARAFGHLGFTNTVIYADPDRDISVALMTTGKPFWAPGVARLLWLLQVVARRVPRDWGR